MKFIVLLFGIVLASSTALANDCCDEIIRVSSGALGISPTFERTYTLMSAGKYVNQHFQTNLDYNSNDQEFQEGLDGEVLLKFSAPPNTCPENSNDAIKYYNWATNSFVEDPDASFICKPCCELLELTSSGVLGSSPVHKRIYALDKIAGKYTNGVGDQEKTLQYHPNEKEFQATDKNGVVQLKFASESDVCPEKVSDQSISYLNASTSQFKTDPDASFICKVCCRAIVVRSSKKLGEKPLHERIYNFDEKLGKYTNVGVTDADTTTIHYNKHDQEYQMTNANNEVLLKYAAHLHVCPNEAAGATIYYRDSPTAQFKKDSTASVECF